jgi:hypothetical protein
MIPLAIAYMMLTIKAPIRIQVGDYLCLIALLDFLLSRISQTG